MFINQDLPYKVADISLSDWGHKKSRSRRDAGLDGRAQKIQRRKPLGGGS
ncbi:MAG: hypothetical protein ACLTTP_12080 [Alistipes ihumii]